MGCVKTDGYTQPIWPHSLYSWTIQRRNEKVSVRACYHHRVRLQLLLIIIITELRPSEMFKCIDVGHSRMSVFASSFLSFLSHYS